MRNNVTAKTVGKFDIFVYIAVVLRAVLGTGTVQIVCFLVAILNIIMNSYWILYSTPELCTVYRAAEQIDIMEWTAYTSAMVTDILENCAVSRSGSSSG
jgi:hypothetical protein